MLKKGKYGIDIHKENQPKVAEMGGLVLLLAITLTCILLLIFIGDSEQRITIFVFLAVILIGGIIGIFDDVKTLGALFKPLLLIIASLPIFLFNRFKSEPVFPIIGQTRLSVVYLFLLPFSISVTGNAVNMLDVFNGSMASTVIILLIVVLIANVIIFDFSFASTDLTIVFSLIIIAVLAAFWIYNRYPAKVFSGDTGSLTIGAAIGAIAIMGQLEVIIVIAMIPFIMNSFSIIGSVKGLVERRDMAARPTKMTDDWKIAANPEPKAPITLVGLIVQEQPLAENDVVKGFNILTITSGVFAIITAILIKMVI